MKRDSVTRLDAFGQTGQTHFLPVATIVMLLLNAVTFTLQQLAPPMLHALDRNPVALAAGEWWRLVTPMFVDPDPYWAVSAKFVGLALIGSAVERGLGWVAWLAVYFFAGVVGEAFGYAWDPHSAGFSLPFFGMIGALLVLLLARKMVRAPVVVLVGLAFIVSIIGLHLPGWADIILYLTLAVGIGFLMRRQDLFPRFAVLVSAVGLLGGGILAVLHDIHGPAVLAGAGLAALIVWGLNHFTVRR